MHSTKTIAITGASGFLGTHTIQNAIERKWHVKAIVRRPEAIEKVRLLKAEPILIKDLASDALQETIKDCDGLVHLIGIVSPRQGSFDQINVGSLEKVLSAASKTGIKRVVFPSGLGVEMYGQRIWANNDYFLSKKKMEELSNESSIPFVIFRPSYILGPHDELIPDLVDSIQAGFVQVIGEGNKPMQPVYVKDATDAFLNSIQQNNVNRKIIELVGPRIISMNDLVQMTYKVLKKYDLKLPNLNIQHIPLEKAAQELDLTQEQISITQCDSIGNNKPLQKLLHIKLTPIEKAIEIAVISAIKHE